jgi:FkbM family methyltransferase
MKALFRKFLRSRGYDICHLDHLGADPLRDLSRIFGACEVKVVFDLGANEGQTAVECATRFPGATVHSFEPFDPAFQALIRAAHQFNNVKPVKTAVGEVCGERTLFVNKSSPTNSLLRNSPGSEAYVPESIIANTDTVKVQVITLDEYCEKNDIGFVDLLKMDVQGYEQRVLQGGGGVLSQGKVATIFIEMLFVPLYDGQAYFHDLYADLWQRGFRLTGVYNPIHNAQHFLSWCDALFVHPDVLASRLAV